MNQIFLLQTLLHHSETKIFTAKKQTFDNNAILVITKIKSIIILQLLIEMM